MYEKIYIKKQNFFLTEKNMKKKNSICDIIN